MHSGTPETKAKICSLFEKNRDDTSHRTVSLQLSFLLAKFRRQLEPKGIYTLGFVRGILRLISIATMRAIKGRLGQSIISTLNSVIRQFGKGM